MTDYDIVIGGGGIAGSSLAIGLAGKGLKILIIEPQSVYEDRVRGEGVTPWGVVEMASLGTDKILLGTCAREVGKFRHIMFGGSGAPREYASASDHGRGFICFPHVQMQEALIQAAGAAGVDVWRGHMVTSVDRGESLSISTVSDDGERTVTTQLLVGADGRASRIATMAGFTYNRGESRTCISGLMLQDFWGPLDTIQHAVFPGRGVGAVTFPLDDKGTARAYFITRRQPGTKMLRGSDQVKDFISGAISAGMSMSSFTEAKPIGPLATYDGTHNWVEDPYQDRVVLIGDAAGNSDPTWGNGLALASRSARVLRDEILKQPTIEAAGQAYAATYSGQYTNLRKLEDWYIDLFYEMGPEATELRAKLLPVAHVASDFLPDMVIHGPEAVSEQMARLQVLSPVA